MQYLDEKKKEENDNVRNDKRKLILDNIESVKKKLKQNSKDYGSLIENADSLANKIV